jgi:hypothetical protein
VWVYVVAIAAVAGATSWRAMTAPARGRRPAAPRAPEPAVRTPESAATWAAPQPVSATPSRSLT